MKLIFNKFKFFLKKIKIIRKIKKKLDTDKLYTLILNILPKVICVDIGASYFPHSKWQIFLDSKRTTWIASDPNSENLSYIKNFDAKCKFKIVKEALDKKPGTKNIYITNIDSGSSLKKVKIPETMKSRIDNNYFYPLKIKKIKTTTLNKVLKIYKENSIFIKLDTQGSELDILSNVQNLMKKNIILGIETESSLLAQTCYVGASKFYKIQNFLEKNGYELIKINCYSVNPTMENNNRCFIPNECDSIFSLRHDIIKKIKLSSKLAMLAFYYSYSLFEEMKNLINNNKDLQIRLSKNNNLKNINKLIKKKLNNRLAIF